jgi:DNA gyrase subunit A
MGVTFVKLRNGDSVSVVARSVERAAEIDDAVEAAAEESAEAAEVGAAEAAVASEEGATIDTDGADVPSTDMSAPDAETEES